MFIGVLPRWSKPSGPSTMYNRTGWRKAQERSPNHESSRIDGQEYREDSDNPRMPNGHENREPKRKVRFDEVKIANVKKRMDIEKCDEED